MMGSMQGCVRGRTVSKISRKNVIRKIGTSADKNELYKLIHFLACVSPGVKLLTS